MTTRITSSTGEQRSAVRAHWSLYLLATIGIGVVLLEVGLHVWAVVTHQNYELNHWVLLVGALLGFAGFYGLKPKETGSGVKIIVDAGTALIPRFLRRSTDVVATEVKVTAVPATAPTTPAPTPPAPVDDTREGGKGGG